jgi:hypothetical protein
MLSPVKIWRNQKDIARLVGVVGTIISWTVIRVPPGDFTGQAPYPVTIVRLRNGTRVTAQLVDWDTRELKRGQRVVTVIRRVVQPNTDGVIPYGVKVKPVE